MGGAEYDHHIFLPNFPGPTFIPCPTSIPEARVWGCACQQGWHRLNIRLHKCFGHIVLCLGIWRRTKKWRNANRLRASGPWIPPKYFTCRRRRCETAHLILLEIIRWIIKKSHFIYFWLFRTYLTRVVLMTTKGYFEINWPLRPIHVEPLLWYQILWQIIFKRE